MHLRRIVMEHLHNMRDLGGYPTTDGCVTKWNLLYRSDSPVSLTSDEWNTLRGLNITLLIDLRSDPERENMPIVSGYPLEYHAVSLMKELDETTEESDRGQNADQTNQAQTADQTDQRQDADHTDSAKTADRTNQAIQRFVESMELDYTKTLFGNLQDAVQILNLILENLKSGGSTLFFCLAGKDRTGITAALVLYLCDVPREDIIADYMVSGIYNEKGLNQLLNCTPAELGNFIPAELESILPDKETLRRHLDSAPKTMADLLDSFESRDIRKALSENGFGSEKQKELKDLMTES